MSKAFTKDEGDSGGEVFRRGPAPLAPGEKRYLTPRGFARFERERQSLVAQRPPLRSNPQGIAGGPSLAELDARLSVLDQILSEATVVEPDPSQHGRAFFGAEVGVDDAGATTTYELVGPDEASPRDGRISVGSPLGRALLGKSVDDTFVVKQPRGERELTVTAIRYPGR